MDNVKMIRSSGNEPGLLELQLLHNGEYITVAGTGACVTLNIWTREKHIAHAFDPVEYVSADGNEISANPVYSLCECDETDGAITAKAGEYNITQRFTVIGEGQIRADVICRAPENGQIEKLMAGLFFMPHKKLARTYDILDFAWLPNLHFKEDHVCGHHFFRSPAAVAAAGGYYIAVIPELDELSRFNLPYALDFRAIDPRAEAPVLKYGVCSWEPDGHIYSIHKRGRPAAHEKEFAFSYAVLLGEYSSIYEISKKVTDYLWSVYGDKYFQDIRPQVMPFEEYGRRYTYKYELWDSLRYDSTGKRAGFNNIHRRGANFHAWENDLNVAYGIKYYGDTHDDKQLSGAADAIKNTVVQSPGKDGAFPCVFNFETDSYEGSLFWTARAADPQNGFDAAAMGVTAWWALYWHTDFEADSVLFDKLLAYCGFLTRAQELSGAVPTYFRGDLSPFEQLRESATSCVSGAVLAKCAFISGDEKLKESAVKCGNFTVGKIIPSLRFNDFETYYSCSPKPLYAVDYYTGIYPHCNLSLQWACDQMLALYRLTGEHSWLEHGEYLLSVLSLYQQVWNPSFLPEYLYGGFGVMNTDGEWNDGRQARFVPTYADYYMATGNTQYLKRAVAACRASFALMDMKENHEQKINSLVLERDFQPNTAGQGRAKPGQGYAPENIHHGAEFCFNGTFGCCWTGMNWSAGGGLAASAYLERHLGSAHLSIKTAENTELICIDGLTGNIRTGSDGKIYADIKNAFPDTLSGRRVKITCSDKADIVVNGIAVSIAPYNPSEVMI